MENLNLTLGRSRARWRKTACPNLPVLGGGWYSLYFSRLGRGVGSIIDYGGWGGVWFEEGESIQRIRKLTRKCYGRLAD